MSPSKASSAPTRGHSGCGFVLIGVDGRTLEVLCTAEQREEWLKALAEAQHRRGTHPLRAKMLKRKEHSRLWKGYNERHFTLDFDQGVLYYGYTAKDENWRKPFKLADIARVEKVDKGWMQIDVDDAASTGSQDVAGFSSRQDGEDSDGDAMGPTTSSRSLGDAMGPSLSSRSVGEQPMGQTASMKSAGLGGNPRPPMMPAVKVVLLGNANVGKTSLILRYCRSEFNDKVPTTVGVDFLSKQEEVDGQSLKVRVWDTVGQDRHLSNGMAPLLFRDASAVLLVFDCMSRASFDRCSHWLNQVQAQANMQSVAVMLGANKIDRASDARTVTRQEAEKFAEENGLLYADMSAKTGEGVQQAMKALLRKHLELEQARERDRPAGRDSFMLRPQTSARESRCRC
mmetsp:Transcript_22582/g.41590  ORF Transcript_22582/g.41590 Transcript_22582/m.41590 type:complete len:399 (-) Transcript_22582:180-1376(-)